MMAQLASRPNSKRAAQDAATSIAALRNLVVVASEPSRGHGDGVLGRGGRTGPAKPDRPKPGPTAFAAPGSRPTP